MNSVCIPSTGFEPSTFTIPVSQRSWVQIPYRPDFFSGPYFHYCLGSVHCREDRFHAHFVINLQFTYKNFIYLLSESHYCNPRFFKLILSTIKVISNFILAFLIYCNAIKINI